LVKTLVIVVFVADLLTGITLALYSERINPMNAQEFQKIIETVKNYQPHCLIIEVTGSGPAFDARKSIEQLFSFLKFGNLSLSSHNSFS
jgi:hypothetical protein